MNGFAKTIFEKSLYGLSYLLFCPYALYFHLTTGDCRKLHVGCGRNIMPGWINADVSPRADLIIFLQRRLPFKSGYLDRIYSEHVLEHVPYRSAVYFLSEARRTLRTGGVIRIAMPDLDDLIDGYQKDWRRFDWVNWPAHRFIKTRAEMINIAFRWWGHQHLYNREELERALQEAGFDHYCFQLTGESDFPDLCGLETRPDSKLIVDAVKS
jgi:predicted SAM-dependent methyltransferase